MIPSWPHHFHSSDALNLGRIIRSDSFLPFHVSIPVRSLPDSPLLNCPFLDFSAARFSSLSIQTFKMLARSRVITLAFHPFSLSFLIFPPNCLHFLIVSLSLSLLLFCYLAIIKHFKAPSASFLESFTGTPNNFITMMTTWRTFFRRCGEIFLFRSEYWTTPNWSATQTSSILAIPVLHGPASLQVVLRFLHLARPKLLQISTEFSWELLARGFSRNVSIFKNDARENDVK